MIFSSVRGIDSTGAASISRNIKDGKREMRISKEVGPFPYLFDLKSFDKLFFGQNQVYIGHNRSKTVGEVTRKNAHPFMFENVVGAHNGTIDYANKNRLEAGGSFRTDSEAIFNHIEVHGIEDTIKQIDKTEAYALTWYDLRDNTINFLRNEHRPLIITFANKGETIFWASEYEILMAALWRNNIEPTDKAHILTPDIHYKFELPTLTSDKFKDPIKKKLENHKWVSYIWEGGKKKEAQSGSHQRMFPGYKSVQEEDAALYNSGYSGYNCTDEDKERQEINKVLGGSGNQTTVNKQGNYSAKEIISQANKVVSDACKILESTFKETKVEKTKIGETKILTPYEVMQHRAWDHVLSSKQHVPDKEKLPLYWDKADLKVFRERATGNWIFYRWDQSRTEYAKYNNIVPPTDMPCQILDVEARHQFKHMGRGKHKKIYYKGYNGVLLDREDFNKKMQQGCLNCDRIPEWGNEVVFVSDDHMFLCEYCDLTPGLRESFLEAGKKKAG